MWYFNWLQSGNNSVVECDLAKVEVAGSNPVSRSKFSLWGRRFAMPPPVPSPPLGLGFDCGGWFLDASSRSRGPIAPLASDAV